MRGKGLAEAVRLLGRREEWWPHTGVPETPQKLLSGYEGGIMVQFAKPPASVCV